MHLYTISRGMKEHVDRAIRDLQAQYFVMNNNKVPTHTQFQVRPIQLWEFVFPREHLNMVLSTIRYKDNNNYCGFNKKFDILRRMLKLKKIPELDYEKETRRAIFNKHIGWHHIGIKDDFVIDKVERL